MEHLLRLFFEGKSHLLEDTPTLSPALDVVQSLLKRSKTQPFLLPEETLHTLPSLSCTSLPLLHLDAALACLLITLNRTPYMPLLAPLHDRLAAAAQPLPPSAPFFDHLCASLILYATDKTLKQSLPHIERVLEAYKGGDSSLLWALHLLHAMALYDVSEHSRALQELSFVEAVHPGSGWTLLTSALAYRNTYQFEACVQAFSKILTAPPLTFEDALLKSALFGRSAVHLLSGQLDHALEDVEAVLAMDPHHNPAHLVKTDILYRQNDFDALLAAFKALDTALPGTALPPAAVYKRGVALARTRQYDEALTELRRVVQLEREGQGLTALSTEALMEVAQCFIALRSLPEAKEAMDDAITINPQDPMLYQRRSDIQSLLGDAKGAVEDICAAFDHGILLEAPELLDELLPTAEGIAMDVGMEMKNKLVESMVLGFKAMKERGAEEEVDLAYMREMLGMSINNILEDEEKAEQVLVKHGI